MAMKVLIAGLGSVGQRHVRNLRHLLGDEVEILAHRVTASSHVINEDMTIAPGEDVEQKHGVRSFRSLDQALAEQPTAVFVCNPSSEHVTTALAAVRAGCHVFIEKPLSHTFDQVDELVTLAERKGLVAAVGYQMRCHPALVRVRELLQARAIGRVVSVRAEMGEFLPDAHPYEDYRISYAARAALGGGVLLCYIHEFDYLCWWFGMPSRVFTIGGRLGDLDLDVEDTALTTLEYHVEGRPVAMHLHHTFLQRPPSRTCEIVGTAGTIRVDLRVPSLVVEGPGGASESTNFDGFQRNQLFLDELRQFLAAIKGAAIPVATATEATASLRVALAAKESLATGRVVELR
jgi:predicted dehydrogenase